MKAYFYFETASSNTPTNRASSGGQTPPLRLNERVVLTYFCKQEFSRHEVTYPV